uniref:Sxl protein n=1 Tax=Nilaparvata lugens TaxID=108931 RepID=M9PLX4_NILLU|nr:sex-lethal [Nilaparvata lugens]
MAFHDPKRLIINYLPQDFGDKELYGLFSTIGPIESCRVMRDNKTNYSYGFGFVTYNSAEDSSLAIQKLNGLELLGKRLKVSYARPSTDEIKDTNLYISNLPKHFTENDLDFLFGKFGQIVQKNILKDKITGMPRGVAFVRFERKDSAQQALLALDGYLPNGASAKLNVKIAEEHGKKKAIYFAGYQAGAMQSRQAFAGPPLSMQMPPKGPQMNPMALRGSRGGPQSRGSANFVPYPPNMAMPGRMVGGPIVRPDKTARRFNPMPAIW